MGECHVKVGKAVVPKHGRPTMGQAQPTFPFGGWVVLKSHVSKSCGMLCLKSVYYNMWAHRSSCLRLIGREGIASDLLTCHCSWAASPSYVQLPSGPFWPLGLPMSDWAFVPWIILANFLSF